MTRKKKPAAGEAPYNSFSVALKDGETASFATARTILEPGFRHAVAVSQIHKPLLGKIELAPGFGDYAAAVRSIEAAGEQGGLSLASLMLAAQAVTLYTIFTEITRRMAINMGDYLGATETYARIAMKAQAQSRATLEALAKLHQPREQTVRHVHVNEGGQAVIAYQIHYHTAGARNAENTDQSHATCAAGAGPCAA